MWAVSLIFAAMLLFFIIIRDLIKIILKKYKDKEKIHENLDKHLEHTTANSTLQKIPWTVIPFVLSLFITVYALNIYGITQAIGLFIKNLIGTDIILNIFVYGFGSALSANILNNIPMSVAFVSIITPLSGALQFFVALAVVIGSNLGANITPIGALAGIMWLGILKSKDFTLSFLDFVKYGVLITGITLLVALGTLGLEVLLFI